MNSAPVQATDNLSDADYRHIFQKLRAETRTFRALARCLVSHYSYAWWSKYERGLLELTNTARNELRAWNGLPGLPVESHVTTVTRAQRRRVVTRAIRVHPDLWGQMHLEKEANGQTWDEFLGMALRALFGDGFEG